MHRGDEAISALSVFASPHAIGTKQSPFSLSLRVPMQSGRSNLLSLGRIVLASPSVEGRGNLVSQIPTPDF